MLSLFARRATATPPAGAAPATARPQDHRFDAIITLLSQQASTLGRLSGGALEAIRMALAGQLAEGRLDLVDRRLRRQAQNVIEGSLRGHQLSSCPRPSS